MITQNRCEYVYVKIKVVVITFNDKLINITSIINTIRYHTISNTISNTNVITNVITNNNANVISPYIIANVTFSSAAPPSSIKMINILIDLINRFRQVNKVNRVLFDKLYKVNRDVELMIIT